MTKHNHRFSTFIGHGESPAQTANEIRRMIDRGEPLPLAEIADLVERHGDEVADLTRELGDANNRIDDAEGEVDRLRLNASLLECEIATLKAENERLSNKEAT